MAELKITKDNFEEAVLKAEVPVLLDFWASWCGPCRMLAPVVAEIAAEYAGKVAVGKVNVDEEPELADAFRITSIPTVIVLQHGKVLRQSVGYCPKETLLKMLEL